MHTHFSAMHIACTFLGVLLAGTAWHLVAYHAVASGRPGVSHVGALMLFQY